MGCAFPLSCIQFHIDGPVDLHPKKREIAVARAGRVRFAIERPRKVFTLSGSWQEINLYADPDTGIFAYSDNPVEYGMNRKGDGTPRKTAHDYGGSVPAIRSKLSAW